MSDRSHCGAVTGMDAKIQSLEGPHIRMPRHESEDMDLVEDPFWWMLRHESETWILQRILRKGC